MGWMSKVVKAIVDAILSGESAAAVAASIHELQEEEKKSLVLTLREIRDDVASNCIQRALEIDALLNSMRTAAACKERSTHKVDQVPQTSPFRF
jgi:hypothetical protein